MRLFEELSKKVKNVLESLTQYSGKEKFKESWENLKNSQN